MSLLQAGMRIECQGRAAALTKNIDRPRPWVLATMLRITKSDTVLWRQMENYVMSLSEAKDIASVIIQDYRLSGQSDSEQAIIMILDELERTRESLNIAVKALNVSFDLPPRSPVVAQAIMALLKRISYMGCAGGHWPSYADMNDEIKALKDENLRLSMQTTEDRELDIQNAACDIVPGKLKDIANTGDHAGIFGRKAMEDAAQAILALHDRATDYQDRSGGEE